MPNHKKTKQIKTKNQPQKATPKASPKAFPKGRKFNAKPWVVLTASMAIMAICVMCAMLIGWSNYLWKAESLSLFLPSWSYWSQCMSEPGGALVWLGAFFTQFFHYPWLGAALFALLLCGIAALMAWAFKMPKSTLPLTIIPGAMLTLFVMSLGYILITLKSPGFIFSNPLGLAAAIALFGAYRSIGAWFWRLLAIMTIIIAGYPFLGFYALFVAALCLAFEISIHKKYFWITTIVAVALMWFVPWFAYNHTSTIVMKVHLYTAGLPRLYAGEESLWWPFNVTFLLLAILAFLTPLWHKSAKKENLWIGASAVLAAASIVWMFLGKYSDENFRITIDMDRALQEGNWEKVTQLAASETTDPTRVMLHYNLAALLRMGQLPDKAFAYRSGDTPFETTREATALRDVGSKMMYLQYGRVNDCYRWTIEDKVEHGLKVEYLKYLTKCALLNGESQVAKKYLRTLASTMFHKDWAAKYQKIADDPALLADDPELSQIKKLMNYNDNLGGDGGTIESHLLVMIGALQGGPPEVVELSMLFNLIRHDLPSFWPKFMLYASTHDRVPTHFQEAALVFSKMQRLELPARFTPSPEVMANFEKFMQYAQQCKNNSDEQNRQIFLQPFGDTYWYNLYFQQDLKTK